jgi:hypothetical protein
MCAHTSCDLALLRGIKFGVLGDVSMPAAQPRPCTRLLIEAEVVALPA